jgi:tetrahydromethanopterin S-methyltransferase subunit E
MAWKSLTRDGSPPELAGFALGAAVFLMTCLLGHPLLLPLCLWLFFLVLGLVAGLSSAGSSQPGAGGRYATWAFVLAVACSIAWRIR